MSATGRALLALAFVGVVTAILFRPVLNAYEDVTPELSRGAAGEPATPAPPSPAHSPSPDPTPSEPADRSIARFPRPCLERSSARGSELVAAYARGKVSIASTRGERVAAVRARPPIAWSASGRFLATGDGDLWRASGNRAGSLAAFTGPWAWSPVADCAVGATGDRLVVARPGADPATLLDVEVTDLSFAPSGTELALAIAGDRPHVVVADLRSGRVRDLVRPGPANCCIRLDGWWQGRPLMWWGPGESVLADGVALRTAAGPLLERPVTPSATTVEACGDHLLVVAGGGREPYADTDLVSVRGSRLEAIAGGAYSYAQPSCNANGEFVVAARAPDGRPAAARLVVMSSDGERVDRVSTAETFVDAEPIWGPAGTGVVFVRRAADGPARVWFIPEGGRPRPLPLPAAWPARTDHPRTLDWSAGAPSGSA